MPFLLIERVNVTLVPLMVERKQKTATLHAAESVMETGTEAMRVADVQVWLQGVLQTVSTGDLFGFVLD